MTITEAKTVVELTAATITSFLDAHSNGITVVDFFTTYCGPCKVGLPQSLREAAKRVTGH